MTLGWVPSQDSLQSFAKTRRPDRGAERRCSGISDVPLIPGCRSGASLDPAYLKYDAETLCEFRYHEMGSETQLHPDRYDANPFRYGTVAAWLVT